MPESYLGPYRVEAFSASKGSENKIHGDAVARFTARAGLLALLPMCKTRAGSRRKACWAISVSISPTHSRSTWKAGAKKHAWCPFFIVLAATRTRSYCPNGCIRPCMRPVQQIQQSQGHLYAF